MIAVTLGRSATFPRYHLAVALHRVGHAADARLILENLLSSAGSFADRAKAEKLMQELKRS